MTTAVLPRPAPLTRPQAWTLILAFLGVLSFAAVAELVTSDDRCEMKAPYLGDPSGGFVGDPSSGGFVGDPSGGTFECRGWKARLSEYRSPPRVRPPPVTATPPAMRS